MLKVVSVFGEMRNIKPKLVQLRAMPCLKKKRKKEY